MYLNFLSKDDGRGVRLGVSSKKVEKVPGWARANYQLATNDLREAQSVLIRVQRRLAATTTPDPTGFWPIDPIGAKFKTLAVLKESGLYRKASQ